MTITKNLGSVERVIRIVVGLALLSVVVAVEGNARYWGLIGLMPLATGVAGWCPPYALFGFSTCRTSAAGGGASDRV